MPIYFAKAYLTQKGRLIEPNETLTLTADQADRLGSKVEAVTKDNLSKKTLDQLKEIARTNNVAGFSTLNKDNLIAKLTGKAAPAATTTAQSTAKSAASATAQTAANSKAAQATSNAKAAVATTADQPTSAVKATDQKAAAPADTAKAAMASTTAQPAAKAAANTAKKA
jgi:hypothetical protein